MTFRSIANNNNVKIINKTRRFHGFLLSGALLAAAAVSCNSSNTSEDEPYVTPANVAVTAFSLNADDKVMENLDSVYFSIDLEHGVIFNADSLPVGTKIDKLVPNITYSTYVTKATIKMEGGATRTGETDYLNSPTDSIDFSGKVTLSLFTEYGEYSMDYKLKVNVHKEKADSLVWDDKNVSGLPSRLDNPKNQKSLDFKNSALSLIEENDGTFTMASSTDLYNGTWSKTQVAFPFTPDIRSLTASSDALYMLDINGHLYSSSDAQNWSDTGEVWTSILGGYVDTAIGLKQGASGVEYTQYPLKDINVTAAHADFPVSGYSNFVILENKWTSSPVGFFVGGKKADGKLSDDTWAFDGTNWIQLSLGGIPPLTGASIIPYYTYRNVVSTWTRTEFAVWMIVGGRKSDGTLNRTVYISYDNGVNWGAGSESLQLPKEIPTMTDCDNVVMTTPKKALISDYWKEKETSGKTNKPQRIQVSIDGNNILWDCPYIYLIGGVNPQGNLCNTIWRGALARLTFTPIF